MVDSCQCCILVYEYLDRKYKLLMRFLPSMEFVGLAKLGFVTSPVGIISPWWGLCWLYVILGGCCSES